MNNSNGRLFQVGVQGIPSMNLCNLFSSSSSLCAICSQHVGCHGSTSFSILCHSDTVTLYDIFVHYLMLAVHIVLGLPRPLLPFHQQSLYPISSYYISKILTFPFLIVFNNDLLVFILYKISPLVFLFFPRYS